jgi:hypothetical protein
VSSQAPHRIGQVCTLAVYEFQYDPDEAQPNPWVLKLGDDSLTFHATVSGTRDTPIAQVADKQTSAQRVPKRGSRPRCAEDSGAQGAFPALRRSPHTPRNCRDKGGHASQPYLRAFVARHRIRIRVGRL